MDKQERYSQLLQDLSSEYRPQRQWAEGRGFFLIVGHFVVGVAAGTMLFGLYFENVSAQILAFVLGCIGGLAHLFNLARPERAIKMMSQVATSWIARGFWGLTFFLSGGFLLLVPEVLPSLWGAGSALAVIGKWLSILGSLILICYMGFCYTASKAIPFWNSPLHPVLYMTYAARGGVAGLLLVLAGSGTVPNPEWNLLQIWIGVTAVVIVLWVLELQAALTGGDETVKRSVDELLKGRLAIYFYGGTLIVGLVVPIFLIYMPGLGSSSTSIVALIGLFSVAGDFFIKFSSIKAGIHLPVRLPHIHQRA